MMRRLRLRLRLHGVHCRRQIVPASAASLGMTRRVILGLRLRLLLLAADGSCMRMR